VKSMNLTRNIFLQHNTTEHFTVFTISSH
jgi:hypothetical protein